MAQTETYKATVKGVKDIHDEENPVKYWLSVGAKPTDRVIGFLAKEGLLKKPPTPKQLERLKIREQKLMKELYESDFHEITWDKKCV